MRVERVQRLEVGKARLVGVLSFVRKWPERDVVYFGIIKKGGRKKGKEARNNI